VRNPALALERAKRKTQREERLFALLMDPTIKRLLLASAIVGYSSYVTGKGDSAGRTETALAVALPTIGLPMLAAEAGITDWKALLALSVAAGGAATLASDKAVDAVTLEAPGGMPVVSLLGPFAGLRWSLGKLSDILEKGEKQA
jgi:hypothetical protein